MRGTLIAMFCISLGGCDKLFSLTHVDRDADIDAAPCTPRSIATGKDHTCSVDYLGRVFCWGLNADRQVQSGGPEYLLVPTRVVLPAAAQVTSGRDFSCARLEDGDVWCWGNNFFGQLGRGATSTENGPLRIEGIPPSAEVRAAGMTVCSRSADTGAIWCWGSNRDRAAGQELDVSCPGKEGCVTPNLVPGTEGAKALAMGHRHACIIDATDHIACWGKDAQSQLGDNAAAPQRTLPGGIPQLGPVSAIAAAGRFTCAVDTNGAMLCWGAGYDGQLATGDFQSAGTPTATKLQGNVTQISLGGFGGCALMAGGTVQCWGSHDAGTGVAALELLPVTTKLDGVTELSAHFDHTCAIAGGDIYCWGENSDGQLGRGLRAISPTPITVGTAGALHVVAGDAHACAQHPDGIYCWGSNAHGEVGSGDLVRQYVPVRVETTLPTITGLAAAFERTCIWGNGLGECWGRSGQYSLGNGSAERSFSTPQRLLDGNVAEIAIGRVHVCIRHPDETVSCYGANGQGQLGASPTTVPASSGGVTPSISGVKKLAAGGTHTCALTATGVSCWGDNSRGQLGDGTKTARYTPVTVAGLTGIVDVKAGSAHTCALDNAGAVWCWGLNAGGQLGDGTRTDRSTAAKAKLPTGRTAVSLVVGSTSTCAKLDTGAVACWGGNGYGGFGTGTTGDVALPTESPMFANAAEVATGARGTCALDAAGQVTCAGAKELLADDDKSSSEPTLTVRSACAE